MSEAVLIFGGSRGTGLEVARQLNAQGERVVAMVRAGSDASALDALGVTVVRGDVLDADAVAAAFAAAAPVRAVVNTVGGKRGEPRPDVPGGRHINQCAQNAGVRRVILVTAIGAGDSQGAVAPKVLEVLGEVLRTKTEVENELVASGLDYTILRPGGMTFDPPSGTAVRTLDHAVMGVINRADLATLLLECLDDPASIGQIYHTIDPEIRQKAPLERGEDLGTSKGG